MYNIWNELSEDSKKAITEEYSSLLKRPTFKFVDELTIKDRMKYLEELFGKENLVPPIKTWEDLYSHNPNLIDNCLQEMCNALINYDINIHLANKLEATFKIYYLIHFGYGGIITNEEWKDHTIWKYCIVYHYARLEKEKYCDGGSYAFIAFHTKEQRDEFLKYNEQLCKDYYMV